MCCVHITTNSHNDGAAKEVLVQGNPRRESQTDADVSKRVLVGDVQLLYISPENLLNNRKYRTMLLSPAYAKNLVALVVDEVHCVKTW